MKRRVRAFSMVWLAVFALTLLIPPFQALAQDDNDGYGIQVTAKADGDSIAVDAEVTGQEKKPVALNGDWSITLLGPEGNEVDSVTDQVTFDKGTVTFSHGFKGLKPGEYQVKAEFKGSVRAEGDVADSPKQKPYTLEVASDRITIEQPDVDDPEPTEPETIGIDVSVEAVKGKPTSILKAEASLKTDATEVEGDWNFTAIYQEDNTKPSDDVKVKGGNKASADLTVVSTGVYVVHVTFDGTADGKKVKGEGSYEVTLPKGGGGKDPVNYEMIASHGFLIQGYDDGGIEDIAASIKADLMAGEENVTPKAKGTWTFEVPELGLKKSGKESRAAFSILHEGLDPGHEYTVHIAFDGKVGKKKVKQETDYQLAIPGMKSGYDYNGGKNTVTSELTLAENAEGSWVTAIYDEDIELVDYKETTGVKGLKYSADFQDLEPGKYQAVTIFDGEIDGSELVVWKEVSFEVKKNGGAPLPGNEKPCVGDPKTGKKIVEDIKGGKMPKTAVDHPSWMLCGGVIATAGLLILGIVYRRKWLGLFGM